MLKASGSLVGPGTYRCGDCGYPVSVEAVDALPQCERCGATRFHRASLFERPTISTPAIEPVPIDPEWAELARSESAGPGLAVAGPRSSPRLFELPRGWTRIGRSRRSDLRLDHPTVSRRHAQIVRTDDNELRVLDDRSLNGVFVNGERIEWSPLGDGDELAIGCYSLQVLALLPAASAR